MRLVMELLNANRPVDVCDFWSDCSLRTGLKLYKTCDGIAQIEKAL